MKKTCNKCGIEIIFNTDLKIADKVICSKCEFKKEEK